MNRSNRRVLRGLLALLMTLPACGPATPSPERRPDVVGGLPVGTLRLGDEEGLSLKVEIAKTAGAQAMGLMNVEKLPDDYGLVFLWPSAGRHSFWMKNTLIPLDIAWWNGEMRIVDIQTMTPCANDPCPSYAPAADHVAAVEVKAGLLEGSGVKVGDPVELVFNPTTAR